MGKMTVQDLKCKLYIETLREQYQNRDFMFTTISEKKLKETKAKIESKLENIRKIMEKYAENHSFSIEEYMKKQREYFVSRNISNCMDEDFSLALLFTCWKERFASENNSDSAIIDSYMQREMPVDLCSISVPVLKEIYSEYISLNKEWNYYYEEEVLHFISSYGMGNKGTLEIDTDFFGESTKVVSKEEAYIISKVLRDLTGVESEVCRIDALPQLLSKESYYLIVAKLSSCKEQSFDGILEFFSKLVSLANKICGRIILIDTERKLASEEMHEFRKKLIDENLLDIFLSGKRGLGEIEGGDIYILYSSSQTENTKFNFVGGHDSYLKNIITAHQQLSKSDVKSVDYDFYAASDLLTGQKGKAYSFRDLFSVPKSGVEERKMSGRYRVFQMKDMQQDFLKSVKNYALLDECEISGSYKMLTEDKLLFFVGDEKIQCCYVEASTDTPVVVGHQFAVLDLNKEVLTPEYVQILCAKGVMERAFSGECLDRKDFRYTDDVVDPTGKTFLYTPEDKILDMPTMIQIPSREQQGEEILDAQFINASAIDRERALEQLLAEKTWLNEEHIRNVKHRIGNELVPVKTDLDAFLKLFQNHPEGVTLNTIRGKNEKVSEILERLSRCVDFISESLQDLTRTIDKNDLKPVDIISVVKDFVRDFASGELFKISLKVPEEHIIVNGSSNMIRSIMRNIVDNAIRHGFVDKTKGDYTIEVSITQDGNGNSVLCIKNNGVPMSELARDNYFKRGSIAGETGHSGIGGADVKDTVNAMGGEVTLPIDENGWAVCVKISLPILNTEKI